jgi:hypothetical protein
VSLPLQVAEAPGLVEDLVENNVLVKEISCGMYHNAALTGGFSHHRTYLLALFFFGLQFDLFFCWCYNYHTVHHINILLILLSLSPTCLLPICCFLVENDVYTWGSNVEGCLGRPEEVGNGWRCKNLSTYQKGTLRV